MFSEMVMDRYNVYMAMSPAQQKFEQNMVITNISINLSKLAADVFSYDIDLAMEILDKSNMVLDMSFDQIDEIVNISEDCISKAKKVLGV